MVQRLARRFQFPQVILASDWSLVLMLSSHWLGQEGDSRGGGAQGHRPGLALETRLDLDTGTSQI